MPLNGTLLAWGVGDALGLGAFDRGHKDFATAHKGDFLAVGGKGKLGDPCIHGHVLDGVAATVVANRDLDLPALFSVGLHIEVPVVGIAEGAALANAQVANRVGLEARQRGFLPCRLAHHVEGTRLFAEVEDVASAAFKNRVQIFAVKTAYLGINAFLEVQGPDIAGHRTAVVLAKEVLVAFAVLKNKKATVLVEAGAAHPGLRDEEGSAPGGGDGVQVLK